MRMLARSDEVRQVHLQKTVTCRRWRLLMLAVDQKLQTIANIDSAKTFMSALRQTLHLCWIGLVAFSLVWSSIATASVNDCEESECCCCEAHDHSPDSSAPVEDCGCHWEMPAPPTMPNEAFDPFSPPILLVTPIALFRTVPAWEIQQTDDCLLAASAVPPPRRRHQSFCVYLI